MLVPVQINDMDNHDDDETFFIHDPNSNQFTVAAICTTYLNLQIFCWD